ncbi:MAG: diacylglycerol kinase [Paracoccaceae bacterium]|nr:diacylglycerol kinase [Paracoccaceae bacterium]
MKWLKNLQIIHEIKRLKNTATWSYEGWMSGWRDEKSLRQWVGLNAVSWILMVVLGFEIYQAALLVALGGLVVIVELINSSIEATVDYVSTDKHPLAKKAKDVASAAVFATALLWLALWIMMLFA